jgi:spoIIIJ-associated protein
MSTSVEASGTTVEEAVDKALEELEEARENVAVEVISEGPPASVRVTLHESHARRSRQVVAELLTRMGIMGQVHIRKVDDPVIIDVSGENLGLLIGWRGETLRAFQTVTNLILNEGRTDRRRVVVDVERYRNRREETVREMALRLADRVRRSGDRILMDPMQAYERRIVHLTLEHEPGVRTESQGEEPNRRVAIFPDGASARKSAERPAMTGAPAPRQPAGYAERPRYGDRPRFGERPRFGDRRPSAPATDEPDAGDSAPR